MLRDSVTFPGEVEDFVPMVRFALNPYLEKFLGDEGSGSRVQKIRIYVALVKHVSVEEVAFP